MKYLLKEGVFMTKEEVIEFARDQRIQFIQLWFTDIIGNLKSVTITRAELAHALEEGKSFDGSSIEGFTRREESDMLVIPEPATFCILPWSESDTKQARMFCDVYLPNGEPYKGDPRYVLKRNLEEAKSMGFSYKLGPELEYFYFKSAKKPELLDESGYFDLTPPDIGDKLRMQTINILNKMGIDVEASHHEVSGSQHEIDLVYNEALWMADATMTYKLVVKQVAQLNGYYATFMPKPIYGVNGSGMHVHQSLFKDDKNVFYNGPSELSDTGKKFLAGLLKHSKEITLITNQWENSYKRLVPGYEAPVYICWARRNRSTLIRVPAFTKEKAARIEYRAPDPACNPYLAFACMLQAGLEGIRKNYELPEPVEIDVYELTREERKSKGIEHLPGSLGEAIFYTEQSELVRHALGDELFEKLLANKRAIWEKYRAQITEYEIETYLPIL